MRGVTPYGRLAVLVVAALGSAGAVRRRRHPRDAFAEGKHRGVCYAHAMRPGQGYGSADSEASLRALAAMGVRWISITPFGFQRTSDATEIRWGGQRIAESDDRLRAVTAQARALGLKVMLKPHIWLRPPAWPGSINHATDAAWAPVVRGLPPVHPPLRRPRPERGDGRLLHRQRAPVRVAARTASGGT